MVKTLLVSGQFDGFLRYVLRYDSRKKEYVTHMFNEQDGGFYYGAYTLSSTIAQRTYNQRCGLKECITIDAEETFRWQERESVPVPTQAEFGESTTERAAQFPDELPPSEEMLRCFGV